METASTGGNPLPTVGPAKGIILEELVCARVCSVPVSVSLSLSIPVSVSVCDNEWVGVGLRTAHPEHALPTPLSSACVQHCVEARVSRLWAVCPRVSTCVQLRLCVSVGGWGEHE